MIPEQVALAAKETIQDRLTEWLEKERERLGVQPPFGDRYGYLTAAAEEVIDEATLGMRGVTPAEKQAFVAAVAADVYGLGDLQELVQPPLSDEISNIEIIGYDRVFVTYRDGRGKQMWGKTVGASDQDLVAIFEMVASGKLGGRARPWDDNNYALNYQLPEGQRVHALRRVVARPTVTIRSHAMDLAHLDDLVNLSMLPPDLAEFLAAAVKAKLNLVVAGATNTGKTTFLRALINEIAPAERLCTIEDNLELGVDHFPEEHPNTVVMESLPANLEGIGGVSIAELLRESLRMNPDRVIVGEVRGAEVLGMFRAMTQGNDGSMCSIHADDADQSVRRLAAYAQESNEVTLSPEAAAERVTDAVDLLVHIRNDDGLRHVSEVVEVKRSRGGKATTTKHIYRMDRPVLDDRTTWAGVAYYNELSAPLMQRCAAHLTDQYAWFRSWGPLSTVQEQEDGGG